MHTLSRKPFFKCPINKILFTHPSQQGQLLSPSIPWICCHAYVFPLFVCTPPEGRTNLRSRATGIYSKKNLSELRLLSQRGTWGILWCFAAYCLCQHSPPVVPRIHHFCQRVTQLCWYCDIAFPEHTKPLNEAANSLDPVSEHLHNIILLVTGSQISLIGTAWPYHPPH